MNQKNESTELNFPHDLTAEQAVLGCLFVTPSALSLVRLILSSPVMFYNTAYGMIFRCMCKVVDRGEPLDHVTIGHEMQRLDYLDRAGGVMVFEQLEATGATAQTVEHYARIIRQQYTYREVMKAGARITEMASGNPEDSAEMYQQVKATLAKACGSAEYMTGAVSASEGARLVWEHLERGEQEENYTYLPVGMCGIEIPRGIVTAIGGRTSNGKTALALNWQLNLARQGHSTLHMGMEDNTIRFFIRLMANIGGVINTKISKARLNQEERSNLLDAANIMAELPMHVCAKKGINIEFIRQYAAAHQANHGLDVLTVDYVQLIRGRRGQSTYDKVSEAMQELVVIAEELDIAVLVVSQVGRPSDKGGVPRPPTMHDLKESGEIENSSKVVYLLHRPVVYDRDADPTVLLLHAAKVSEGAPGAYTLRGDMPHMYVGEPIAGEDESSNYE